jgi:hypothetical protein
MTNPEVSITSSIQEPVVETSTETLKEAEAVQPESPVASVTEVQEIQEISQLASEPTPAPISEAASATSLIEITTAAAPETLTGAPESPALASSPEVVEIPVASTAEATQVVQVMEIAQEVPAPAVVEEPKPEIREVQSQLSELKGETATEEPAIPPKVVDYYLGFNFRNTGFFARSGLEFVQAVERIPLDNLQYHLKNADFEKWFAEVLTDSSSAEALKTIRESGTEGELLRLKVLGVLSPKYKR